MRVIVDTNTFYSDLAMAGPLRVLLDASAHRELALIVPEVVLQEVFKRFRIRYEEEAQKLDAAVQQLTRLGAEGLSLPRIASGDEALVMYEADIRTRLHDAGATVAFLPSASHDEVLERAIARQPPFKENGSGYQDTLIWLTALDEAAVGEELALISHDKAAFGDREAEGGRVRRELRADLEARGLDASCDALWIRPRIHRG